MFHQALFLDLSIYTLHYTTPNFVLPLYLSLKALNLLNYFLFTYNILHYIISLLSLSPGCIIAIIKDAGVRTVTSVLLEPSGRRRPRSRETALVQWGLGWFTTSTNIRIRLWQDRQDSMMKRTNPASLLLEGGLNPYGHIIWEPYTSLKNVLPMLLLNLTVLK